MTKEYLYGMRMRGFSIGCQPKDGFLDRRDDPDGKYYDIIVYDRPLTESELDEYELDSLNDGAETDAASEENQEMKGDKGMATKFDELKLRIERCSTEHSNGKSTGYHDGWTVSADDNEIRIDNSTVAYTMTRDGECRGVAWGNEWRLTDTEIERKLVDILPGGYNVLGVNGPFAEIELGGIEEETEKIPPRETPEAEEGDGLFDEIELVDDGEEQETKVNEPTIRPMVKTLEDLFVKFNEKFFGGELETPVITIAPDTCRSYGWFTTWRAWKETGNEDSEGYYEINVSSDYLNRDPVEVAATLLHEMVHLYDEMQGVKDCSRAGKYHNKKFQMAAEAHGLICEKSQKYGFSITKPTEETVEFIKSFDLKFNLYRPTVSDKPTPDDDEEEKDKPRKKSSTRKYVCPVCGTIIRSTKDVNVICGDCGVPFELVES